MKKYQLDLALDHNPLATKVVDLINTNTEIKTLWRVVGVTAQRMSITDHGFTHFQIVAKNALQIFSLLIENKVIPGIVRNYKLSVDHAELVVVLASLLHDMGMSIHRKGHEEFSLFITNNLLRELLDFMPIEERTVVISETLHAIISHRSDGQPLTMEAGIVRVADALDMSKGRSRLPYEPSKLDIHTVSALAIDEVIIHAGKSYPVQIDISMNHTAGLFQVDELLKKKVMGSSIEQHLDIKVYVDKGEGKQLFKDFYQKR